MCSSLVTVFMLTVFLILACCLCYLPHYQSLVSKRILKRIRSFGLCLLLLRPSILGSKPSFASIMSVKTSFLSLPLPKFYYAYVALLWWLIPSCTFLQPVQTVLSWFVDALADCLVNPKTVLVDVVVALVATFLSVTLYHLFSGPTYLVILPGSYPIDFALSSLLLGRSSHCLP
jgi:hypothetical protein